MFDYIFIKGTSYKEIRRVLLYLSELYGRLEDPFYRNNSSLGAVTHNALAGNTLQGLEVVHVNLFDYYVSGYGSSSIYLQMQTMNRRFVLSHKERIEDVVGARTLLHLYQDYKLSFIHGEMGLLPHSRLSSPIALSSYKYDPEYTSYSKSHITGHEYLTQGDVLANAIKKLRTKEFNHTRLAQY